MKKMMAFVLVMVFLLGGCVKQEQKQEVLNFEVYYADRNNEKIVTENRTMQLKQNENKYERVLEELLKGPQNKKLRMVIHPRTKIYEAKKNNDTIQINFSKEFIQNNGEIEQMAAIMTTIYTLTQFEEVKAVKIFVEGKELKGTEWGNNKSFGDSSNQIEVPHNQRVTLYFGDANAEKLVGETREVELGENEKIEERLVKELIKGPEKSNLHKTIPVNTKVLWVKVEKETAEVNLSEEFFRDHWGGSAGETMTIYSLVNTLTELPHITKVRFLIEGQEREVYMHYVFNESFKRDATLIRGESKF